MRNLPLMLVLVLIARAGAHPGHEGLLAGGVPAVAPEVSIVVAGEWRVIRSNGIPDHVTGTFPGRGNPNTISAQKQEFRVSAAPKRTEQPTPNGMNLFGVAVNGVVFDPAAAEWWENDPSSGWQYDALGGGKNLGVDAQHAHVQPNGKYHYHGIPEALVAKQSGGEARMALVGWAADGFPIYGPMIPGVAGEATSPLKHAASSYRLKVAERISGPGGKPDGKFVQDWDYVAGSGDLDECNGRSGPTPEFPGGTYYYVLTETFPFVPRLWRGTPEASFLRQGPPRGGPGGGKKKGRPR